MVFEKLGPSLYDFLRRNDYQPFPLAIVQSVARQLLEAVAFMHELQLVHTDLKPENILLRNAEYTRLPAVDASGAEAPDGSRCGPGPSRAVSRWWLALS